MLTKTNHFKRIGLIKIHLHSIEYIFPNKREQEKNVAHTSWLLPKLSPQKKKTVSSSPIQISLIRVQVKKAI